MQASKCVPLRKLKSVFHYALRLSLFLHCSALLSRCYAATSPWLRSLFVMSPLYATLHTHFNLLHSHAHASHHYSFIPPPSPKVYICTVKFTFVKLHMYHCYICQVTFVTVSGSHT